MKQRIATALWGLPLLFFFVWFPWFPVLVVLIAIVAILAGIEFYRLATLSNGSPLTLWGLAWILGFVVYAQFGMSLTWLLLVGAMGLPLIWLLSTSPRNDALLRWSWTSMGIMYIGWALSCYVSLRGLDSGVEWVFLAILPTFACDTAAFFYGRAWGRHPLAPSLSPGKTWEGAVAGLVAAVVAVVVLGEVFSAINRELPLGYWEMLGLGMLIGIMAQAGDLWESHLKRGAGVKDSGNLLPGHGGILDRLDSLIFSGVVVYYCAVWVV